MNDLEKYLRDPKFVEWVKKPTDDLENYWQVWICENPDKKEELLRAKELFRSIKFKEYPFIEKDKYNDWKAINTALNQNKGGKNYISGIFMKVAAVILLAVISGLVIFYVVSPSINTPVAHISKKAESGQKLTLQLPDGTKVKLNSGSEIIYPSEFTDTLRSVVLKGEGYFEVRHNRQKPFEVISGNVVTQVLGTAFCINSFQENNVKVVLVNGSIEVNSLNIDIKNVVLEPGQKATWNSTHFEITELDPIHDLGWKENILVFNNSNISDISEKLERWYGVNVEVFNHDQIANSFYGKFENENLENVLKSIGHALEFEFQIDKNNVKIKPQTAMHEP